MYIYRNVSRTEFTWNEQALPLNLADAVCFAVFLTLYTHIDIYQYVT